MKGICIILVVLEHCGGTALYVGNGKFWSMLEHLRMPLYFFLSGCFFKEYTCFVDFLVRKVNKQIVPLLFIAVCIVVCYVCTGILAYDILDISKNIIGRLFVWTSHLWFLRTLFLSAIIYYGLYKLPLNNLHRFICSIVIGILACFIKEKYPLSEFLITELYNNFIAALIVQPFLCCANIFRSEIMRLYSGRVLFVVFNVSLILWYLFSTGGVYLVFANVQNKVALFYISSFAAVSCLYAICSLLLICNGFEVLRAIVIYFGRYSIIVFGFHPLVIEFCNLYLDYYTTFLVVLALMPVMIWFFKRYFPAFVAQRDIFVYDNGKIKVDWNVFSLKNR